MPGVFVAQLGPARDAPNVLDYPVANNQTIYAGDWVVLSGAGGTTRVRKLTSTDITNNYTEATVVKGLLGIAMNDVITDASGRAVAQMPIPNVHPQSQPIFTIPTTPAGFPHEPTTGAARLRVIVADAETVFAIRMRGASNAAITFNQSFQGKEAGLQIFNTIDFAANTASTGAAAALVINGVLEMDPNFNVSSTNCFGLVQVKPAYQQIRLGVLYAV